MHGGSPQHQGLEVMDQPLNLAILTSTLYKMGGAQIFTRNIASELARHGHLIDVYTPDSTSAPNIGNLPYRVRGLPFGFFTLVNRIPLVGKMLATIYLHILQRKHHYDGWLAIMSYPSGYILTGLSGRVPIVLRCSGADIQKASDLDYGFRLNPAMEEIIRHTLLSFDRVVALTSSVTEEFRSLGVGPERIVVIPNGVDLDRLHPVNSRSTLDNISTREELRNSLGWPTGIPIVLTIGRNHIKKGYELIPVIARRLVDRGAVFHWYLVGLHTTLLEPALKEHGVADFVTCVEEIGASSNDHGNAVPPDKIVHMYQAADIFAFPSLLETFGMVQLEAMAAGLAVVSTDAPGCRDVVKPGVNGLQAAAGSPESFTIELLKLLEDKSMRNHLAQNGLAFAQGYGWGNIARQYEELFKGLSTAQ